MIRLFSEHKLEEKINKGEDERLTSQQIVQVFNVVTRLSIAKVDGCEQESHCGAYRQSNRH